MAVSQHVLPLTEHHFDKALHCGRCVVGGSFSKWLNVSKDPLPFLQDTANRKTQHDSIIIIDHWPWRRCGDLRHLLPSQWHSVPTIHLPLPLYQTFRDTSVPKRRYMVLDARLCQLLRAWRHLFSSPPLPHSPFQASLFRNLNKYFKIVYPVSK